MKKILLFLFVIIFSSCNENPVKKPANLLDKTTMKNILFDIHLLQAANSFASDRLVSNGIKMNEFIYKKYKIDSLTLAQNQLYYAADTKVYEKMHNEVLNKVDQLKAETDSLIKNQNTNKKELKTEN